MEKVKLFSQQNLYGWELLEASVNEWLSDHAGKIEILDRHVSTTSYSAAGIGGTTIGTIVLFYREL